MIHKVIPGIAFVYSPKNVKISHFRSFYGQKNITPESTDMKGFEGYCHTLWRPVWKKIRKALFRAIALSSFAVVFCCL